MKTLIIEVFKDRAKAWRWRVSDGNGKILAASSESYVKLDSARRSLERVTGLIAPGVATGESSAARKVKVGDREFYHA